MIKFEVLEHKTNKYFYRISVDGFIVNEEYDLESTREAYAKGLSKLLNYNESLQGAIKCCTLEKQKQN